MKDNGINSSKISLKLPNRISGITRHEQRLTNNDSIKETLEQLRIQNQSKNDFNSNSQISSSQNRICLSNQSTLRLKRRNKNRRQFKRKKKKRKKSAFDSNQITKLINEKSNFSEIGNLCLQELLKNNLTHKLDELYSCKEEETEDEVVHTNNIGTVKQQIKISNTNCSCRIF